MKTNHIKYYLYLTVSFIFLSKVMFAQSTPDALRLGMEGLGSDARALGMGNSYIGLSDDASAAFFNPAGFGLLKRIEFSGGLDYTYSPTNTTFFNNTQSNFNSATRLNSLSLALPFPTTQGSLVFGVSYHQTKDFESAIKFSGFNSGNNSLIQVLNGDTYYDNNNNPYNIPYDLGITDTNFNTPINGHLNQSGSIVNSGSLDNWTFSGAIEVARNVFVGLNLNIVNGDYSWKNKYYEDDTQKLYQGEINTIDQTHPVDFQEFYLYRTLDWNISGWNAKAGLLYQFNDYGRFGLTIQFPKYYTVKEKFDVTGESYFQNVVYDLPGGYGDNVKYDIVSPFEFGTGLSVNLKGLILSGQATLIDYSQLKFDNPDGLDQSYVDAQNDTIRTLLGPVINYSLGAEYTVPDLGLRIRAGYIGQPSPYKNDPPEYSRKYFTAGLGFLFAESFTVDLGYAHGWWKDYGDNYGSNESRTFQDVTLDKLILTTTFRF